MGLADEEQPVSLKKVGGHVTKAAPSSCYVQIA